MIDVMFPKRVPTPRERDTRPVPTDYRPKQLRTAGPGSGEGDGYYEEPGSLLDNIGINLHKLEDELSRNRLNEIAALVRSLTYGEMIELARAIWKIRPDGAIDQNTLPMMLHTWSTSPFDAEPDESKPAEDKTSEE